MHTHTRAHRTAPSSRPGHVRGAPQPSSPQAPPPLPTHPPALHVGAPRRQAASLPTSPSLPRRGREGAALGSDGQSGRPIEPGTAFPKGGRCSSDGPNERGARVGLPPGIPLARLAGLWVTRKLGGRRRRPRLRSPVSDSRPPSPPNRGEPPAPTGHPDPAGRARRRRLEPGSFCWARTPSFWWQQSRAVGTAARGRGAARAGLRAPPGAAGPKKWGAGNRAGAPGDRPGHPAQKYAEGPLAGPGTRGEPASQKFGGGRPGRVHGCAPRGAWGLSGRHFPLGPAFVSRVSSPCCARPPPAAAAAEALARAAGGRAGGDDGQRDVLPKAEADLPDAAAADRGLQLSLRRDALLRAADAAAQSRGGGAKVPAAPGVPFRPAARYA